MSELRKERPVMSARLEWISLALLLSCVVLALNSLPFRDALERATLWIEALGWWAPAAFVALYVLCTLLLVPRTVLTVASGFLFGFGWGSLWALLAINLGANLAFWTGRRLARETVARRTRNHVSFRSLDRAVGHDGWRIVALTRLSPVFPYSILNYAFGVTRVAWPGYFFGSFLGMLPGTILLVGLGTLTDFAAERSAQSPGGMVRYALVGMVVIALASTLFVTRFAKRALDRRAGGRMD
jgi:uncharacterized membrane protein YdjX (TVP38/TMEM64 family)